MKPVLPIFLLLGLVAPWASAQNSAWDTSGNGLLKGSYNFRQVYFETGDDVGNFSKAVALWGAITFDGAGNYSLNNASVLDSTVGSVKTLTASGTYAISSSGFGFMDNPERKGALIFGLVSQGVFVGSTTEDKANDLFVAIPAAATAQTAASFNGRYWVAELSFPSVTAARALDAFFQVNPNGQGSLGNVSVTGYSGGSGTKVTRTITNPTYSFAAGQGAIAWGTSAAQVSGDRILYLSADGNVVLGGSNNAYDIFVGVRALSGAPSGSTFTGLYYTAGLDQDNGSLSSDNFTAVDSYYGAFLAASGNLVGHQRLQVAKAYAIHPSAQLPTYDYTYSDTYDLAADGSYDDFFGVHYLLGAGGAIQIGVGTGTYLGINVGLKAPNLSGSGAYINPIGVVNAASYSPFTVGVSQGGMIRIFGTGLANETKSDSTFPKTLANVQVVMNNRQAPIYQVSPGEIVAVVPWGTTEGVVSIQVINNGTASNKVTTFLATVTPGVFTLPQNGLGYAAALHSNFTVVNAASPARAGETIAVYLTGMGRVTPAVADGAPGPSTNPLSKTFYDTAAYVDGKPGTVVFAGLAPGFIGLYQMNITLPTGLTIGDDYLDISGVGAYNTQVLLPIGRATGAADEPIDQTTPQSITSEPREDRGPKGVRHRSVTLATPKGPKVHFDAPAE